MTHVISDTLFMTQRHFRNLLRQPAWILISLVQPVVWLLLYGALFRKIVEIPGFGAASYIDFLTPGIVVMTCLFSAGWSGMDLIEDIDRGVVDRFLVSPASRSSLIAGRLLQGALVGVIQSVIIVVLGLIIGAEYPGGVLGIAALTIASVLLGTAVGALSNAIGVLSRNVETMVAVSNFVLLPLTFMSSVFMARALMPGWMQSVATYNPVEWAVNAGREALVASPDWGVVLASDRLAARLHARVRLARHGGVPRVPEVDLTTREGAPGAAAPAGARVAGPRPRSERRQHADLGQAVDRPGGGAAAAHAHPARDDVARSRGSRARRSRRWSPCGGRGASARRPGRRTRAAGRRGGRRRRGRRAPPPPPAAPRGAGPATPCRARPSWWRGRRRGRRRARPCRRAPGPPRARATSGSARRRRSSASRKKASP